MYIFIFILSFILFNSVFFLHELGHYITSRKFGVKVNEFSFGMGPRIFKVNKNESIYSLRVIPIGFSCSLEEGNSTNKSFNRKNNFKRTIILLSSIFMDLISSFLLSVCISSLKSNIYNTKIDGFFQNSTSDSVGKLKMGDEIISINNYKTHIDTDILFAIETSGNNDFTFDVVRNGELIEIKNVALPIYNYNGKDFAKLDFILCKEDKNFINIMIYSSTRVGSFIRMFLRGLVGLVTRKLSVRNFPESIHIINQIDNSSNIISLIVNLLHLSMIISISLLVINLIPMTPFSSGIMLLILIEKITKRKVNSNFKDLINVTSFIFVVFLSFIIIINDILKITKGI